MGRNIEEEVIAMPNPFKPTAGSEPPVLVGREQYIEDFQFAIEDGSGAPGRLSFITGARGVGKTVMLNALSDVARGLQWNVVNATAEGDFIQEIIKLLQPKQNAHAVSYTLPSVALESSLPGVQASIGLGGVQVERNQGSTDLRQTIGHVLDAMDESKQGVLITLDEVGEGTPLPQLRSFATAIQHLIEEKRNIAVIFAGVPHMVDDVVNDSVLTFLRRAERYQLQDVPIEDVWEAFETTLSGGGKNASYDVLNALARATHGYPFMIQLVGYWAWRQSVVSGHEDFISMEDCESGIAKAKDKLGDLVNAPAVAHLSAIARDYLLAMALDDGPSNTGDIARRLGKTPQYANVYRDRLIREDYITATDYGKVDFKMPYLREFLQSHAAMYQMSRNIEDSGVSPH